MDSIEKWCETFIGQNIYVISYKLRIKILANWLLGLVFGNYWLEMRTKVRWKKIERLGQKIWIHLKKMSNYTYSTDLGSLPWGMGDKAGRYFFTYYI